MAMRDKFNTSKRKRAALGTTAQPKNMCGLEKFLSELV
jgi:hypothetical protein